MAASDILAFIAPEFADSPANLLTYALSIAEPYRPSCLPQAKGDEAVALYAAWLLSVRGSGDGSVTGGGMQGALIEQSAGDTTLRWAAPGTAGVSAASLGNYKARYDALARLCAYGSIMTRLDGNPLPVPDWTGNGFP